jgi:hypothetical protein
MAAVAESLGYARTTVLLTRAATSRRVISAIQSAAEAMKSGDAFWVTYSGHGGQVTDTNGDEARRDYGESGEVGDVKDETWCLYDRQLIDDELWALWAAFPARSRIFVLSDSCHSGSVTRDMPDWDLLAAGAASVGVTGAGGARSLVPAERGMPRDVADRVQQARATTYARIQDQVPPREATRIGATVALVSGCQDNQTSLDGDRNGLFTEKLLQVWDGGAFSGSLHDLRNLTAKRMPATQSPNYYVVGRPNARALRRPALQV